MLVVRVEALFTPVRVGLHSLQVSLALRKRAEHANSKLFSEEERNALDLKPLRHPFWRGWNVLVALIAVCLFGAVLVVATVALGPASEEIVTPMDGGS
jgi:hypothetical protein